MGYNLRRKPRIQTQYGRTTCAGGCSEGRPRWHHSREESQYCNQLMMLVKAGELRSYRTQIRYDLKDFHGNPVGYMIVDFAVIRADGSLEIREFKGLGFQNMMEFRHKKALFSWCYADLPYVVVTKKDIVL